MAERDGPRHRRAKEFAPLLDFALITHNHNDHWRQDFYGAMNGAGKTVVSNFLDNYGVRNWRRAARERSRSSWLICEEYPLSYALNKCF